MNKIKNSLEHLNWQKIDVLAPLVLFVLILMLCWKLASLFWWIIAPPQVIQAEPVVLGSQQAQIPNISSFALFQEESQINENLNFQLQGVVIGVPRTLSSAVIKVNDVPDRYVIGDKIEGSAYELSEVYWDHIVLTSSSGAIKEIKFQGIENLDQPITLDQNKGSASPVNPNAPAGQINQNQNNSNQNILGNAINQIEENREQYLKNMGVNATNGQGYEVSDQTPVALRNKLGLRAGDRILSLNGQTVGQGQTEAQLLEQVKKEGKVKIEVKRGDQVMTFQQDL
ncbi:type II secretion system protein N [Acinetobacter shaoyimingii]|uniref:PDZ domain-containing protein n=1 Tax=Acinetobacter shaoyimingii TaxID=2715164 RepID=A0A6G8RZE2_9GAMM|nr:type II secretion system protein N [Acinetobacter shaoyimingii]QIO07103.1 PDZ domain-containing protein [Acinetobacter shaoyimingii]